MRVSIHHYDQNTGWDTQPPAAGLNANTLVLLFAASRPSAAVEQELQNLAQRFSSCVVMGCSTAGQISADRLLLGGIVLAVLQFEFSRLQLVASEIKETKDSRVVGAQIAQQLQKEGLKSVFTLTDGLKLNGSAYVTGLNENLPAKVIVTGGMAADDDRFEQTWVMFEGERRSGLVLACGFYGQHLTVRHASRGGWDMLGITRKVTRSRGNVLYSLDDQPALAIYKKYLGDKAAGLPGTGLLFPLAMVGDDEESSTVRTILGVDEQEQSITYAGDIPQGAHVRLMHANFDRLIDGAELAAEELSAAEVEGDGVCIAISCVGRKLLLGTRAEEELEAVHMELPDRVVQLGYYSYGEISPLASGQCDLHNQTMTLTLMWET